MAPREIVMRNPLQRVIDEAGRQLLGRGPGGMTRNRSAGRVVPGSGGGGSDLVIVDDGRFRIGVSRIGGTDKIGQVGE
jgi:hypothetical protein